MKKVNRIICTKQMQMPCHEGIGKKTGNGGRSVDIATCKRTGKKWNCRNADQESRNKDRGDFAQKKKADAKVKRKSKMVKNVGISMLDVGVFFIIRKRTYGTEFAKL